MYHILTDYLEERIRLQPDKVAYIDPSRSLTFAQMRQEAFHVAQGLINRDLFRKPVVIYMDKSVECIAAILGVAYSGNFYTVLDTAMPASRISRILTTLEPRAIVTTNALLPRAREWAQGQILLPYEELSRGEVREEEILACASRILSSDVLYVLFTSGSTGVPKGVTTSHGAVVHFLDTSCRISYGMSGDDVMLNQCPFYFVMSITDIFMPMVNGSVIHLVPESYYSFPLMLMKYIEEHRITCLSWVPSAMGMAVSTGALDTADISSVNLILFGGEVMPIKILKVWREKLPHARFYNCYGSTESTDGCISYLVNRDFEDHEVLPIGKPDANMDILLLDENDQLVTRQGELGEICVRSASLCYGYYNDAQRTRAVFVQNPLNKAYEEKIYRTGDLARVNSYGELEYAGRKDFQIKYMGHRIELGEIESNVTAAPGIEEAACLYDTAHKTIVLYYVGGVGEHDLGIYLKEKLPPYMLPRKRIRLEEMPHNAHGKIDRVSLKALLPAD